MRPRANTPVAAAVDSSRPLKTQRRRQVSPQIQSEGGKEREGRTFGRDSPAHERQSELGPGPGEAEIARELEAGYAYASSMPVHSDDGDLPATEDGKC